MWDTQRYGESVGSYFAFLRWIVMVNFGMGIVGFIFLCMHLNHLATVVTATEVADAARANITDLATLGEEILSFRWTNDHFYHAQVQ